MPTTIPETVLADERVFFDREAAALQNDDLILPQDQIERYRRARLGPGNIAKDAMFALLHPLEGKEVLDYACGHGANACLLAACGARVTAFDLSPKAIEKARHRAELNGVADRIQFDVRAAGDTGYPPDRFDVVIGCAVLHHLHMALPEVCEEIVRVLKPDGTACFLEPVANNAFLRFLRPLVPVSRYATENERQLRYQDLEPLRQLGSLELHHFLFLERLHRIFGDWVRVPLRWHDHHAQRVFPFLRPLYGEVVIVARPRK
ncbi:MAG TPA: class I SAM-dependent methyltransferase [Thermoanaerobaculia bacterium]|jgi:ubiquinone/menaquinone biosynthesis C-methylase UbiE|nr:class I SAM-dependent methyltransferase [Thermoanaerobaculia bacterium]